MVITMDMYKEVRKLAREGISQRQIAKRLGISRHTVKKYAAGDTMPGVRQAYTPRPATVLTPEVCEFIAACLEQDEAEGTRKQQHTARRVYQRLVAELGFTGAESTVRAYVKLLRGKHREPFVPLAFAPGEAMQIDWGEAAVYLDGVKVTVNLFCARLCYSDAIFVAAYRRQNSESFLDALVRTFEFFGGVPQRVIFDNGKVAVKSGFGANAEAQDSYASLAAHYAFQPIFCNPRSGNEKGLVENLVGFSRRNFCVPVPHVKDMAELNAMLLTGCQGYFSHQVQGKPADVGTLYQQERDKLYPLPGYRFDPAKRVQARVSRFSTVRCDTNTYSVPVDYCGREVAIKAMPETIEVYCDGVCIARHPRCFGHNQSIYTLEHYLPLLRQKGRAIFQAQPVRDNVPPEFLAWLERQNCSAKELVTLLERALEFGFDAVMRNEVPTSPTPQPQVHDSVPAAEVDLSAYDQRFLNSSGKGEVSA